MTFADYDISPLPRDVVLGKQDLRGYPNARKALSDVLRFTVAQSKKSLLLPAYIGWSSREGSGVFDPVRELGINYRFYSVDRRLQIDPERLLHLAADPSVGAVLFVHWFGFVDPAIEALSSALKERGILVIEDCAHALLTDRVGHRCGRFGDAAFYSLHKILPLTDGGMLRINNPELSQRISSTDESASLLAEANRYDLDEIAKRRCENVDALVDLLEPLRGRLDFLHQWPQSGIVPQTWPVIVSPEDREKLYFGMNSAGFGLVSLYHALISELDPEFAEDAYWVSQRISNLPIHQDVTPTALQRLTETMKSILSS